MGRTKSRLLTFYFAAGLAVGTSIVGRLGYPSARFHAGKRVSTISTFWLLIRRYVLLVKNIRQCLVGLGEELIIQLPTPKHIYFINFQYALILLHLHICVCIFCKCK